MDSRQLVRLLQNPGSWPWRPDSVELIETHISWVFLAGDRVLKVKRPVHLGFVDHSSLAQRRHSCDEEVRLNRRLASDIYLRVVPITAAGDGLAVEGEGDVIEWGTLMRRLPADAMLDVRLRSGQLPGGLAGRLADRLIPFHRDIAPVVPGSPAEVAGIVTGVVQDNLDELAAYPVAPAQFGLVATAMRRFVVDHPNRMLERAASGWIRDGHGDLRCEHVSLPDSGPPDIIDCIEFSDELRYVDIASDLAFLLMDLDRLGAGSVAEELLERYRQAGFDLPDDLMRFYWAHRALVRAKVWYLRDPDGLAHADRAVRYLDLASRQVVAVRPVLICMTGLSGTGKSVIARQVASALAMPVLASDQVRKDLAGIDGDAGSSWQTGIYTERWTDATYEALFQGARRYLEDDQPVLLDATFLESGWRERAASLARELGVPFVLVETTCEEAEVRRRLAARAARGDDPSDAGTEIHARQLARYRNSPPRIPSGTVQVRIDTGNAGPAPLEPVFDALLRQEVLHPGIPGTPLDFRTR